MPPKIFRTSADLLQEGPTHGYVVIVLCELRNSYREGLALPLAHINCSTIITYCCLYCYYDSNPIILYPLPRLNVPSCLLFSEAKMEGVWIWEKGEVGRGPGGVEGGKLCWGVCENNLFQLQN